MADNKIISEYEDMDRVYSDFSKAIGNFSDTMSDNIDQIMSTVDSMGNQWRGNGYNEFRQNISGRVDDIRLSLEKCYAIKNTLDKASQKIKIVLESLRESE